MSYILDALQKSEQDRQNQQAPSLANQYDAQSLAPIKKPKLMWWLVGLLAVLIAVVVAYLVFQWLQKPESAGYTPPASAKVSAAQANQAEATPTLNQPIDNQPGNNQSGGEQAQNQPTSAAFQDKPTFKEPEPKPLDPKIADLYSNPPAAEPEYVYADDNQYQLTDDGQPEAVAPPTQPKQSAAQAQPSAQPQPAAKPQPGTIVEPVVTAGTIAPAQTQPSVQEETTSEASNSQAGGVVEGGFMSIDQLPDSVKSEIPAIRYVAHVYAGENKAGFAILNDYKLKAGEKLADELYLEKVDKDHIVMSYRGYFFRLAAMQNWKGQ